MNEHGQHNLKFFDVEVFPNWWCVVVSDEENYYPGTLYKNEFDNETENKIKNKMRVYTSDMNLKEVRLALLKDLSKGVLTGYNIKKYDLKILKCIFGGFTPEKVHNASQILINSDLENMNFQSKRIYDFLKFGWTDCEAWYDMLDDSEKSLKDKECAHGMDIRETTVSFDKVELTNEDKENIIFYCKHDVYALHVYYWVTTKPYLDTKLTLCEKYGFDRKLAYTNTNAVLVGKFLYAEKTSGSEIRDPRIHIENKKLNEYFQKWIPKDVYEHLLSKQESKTFELFENTVDIGDGGLHSVLTLPKIKKRQTALYVESNEDYILLNVDVSSCYPSVMIYCDAMSRAIKKPEVFKDIFDMRIYYKKVPKDEIPKELKNFLQAGKLILNTTYGAEGNKYLPLFDEYMRSKCCRIGQMFLIALSNCIYENIPCVKILQTNTDGVLIFIKRSEVRKVQNIVTELAKISNFTFDFEEDSKLWQLNVNNYLASKENGSVKAKGAAFITSVHQEYGNRVRPLHNHCVVMACIEYLTKGTNPFEYIRNLDLVEKFCLCCTKGGTYSDMVQYNKDETVNLGKVSRVIAVKNENFGIIKKIKTIKKETKNQKIGDVKEDSIPLCPPHPLVINDALYNYEISNDKLHRKSTNEQWEIDYEYYDEQIRNALDFVWFELENLELKEINKFNLDGI